MTPREFHAVLRALAAIFVATATVGGLAVGFAAAQADDPTECERELSDLFDGEDECIDWGAYASGWFDRARETVGNILGDEADGPTAEDHAAAAAAQVNGHAAVYLDYLNAVNRINATESAIVVRVHFVVDDSEATRYLVAEGNATTGRWTGLRAVENTSLAVDGERALEGAAAENVAEELATVRDQDWFRDGKQPTNTYVSRLAGRYGSDVITNLYEGDGGDA